MGAVRITERFAFSGGKVNREGTTPYVEGVVICGFSSQNRRDYKPEAWAGERVKRYEGRPVYVNHAAERTAESKLGWFEQVRVGDAGKPVGRFCINPKHPMAEQVLWAAEHKPDFYGMSHVADCDVTRSGGREVIEEVLSVASIDLVAEPATVKGFFESTGGGEVTKFKEFVTNLAITDAGKLALLAPLTEDMGEVPVSAGTGSTLADGINALAHAVIDDPDLDAPTKRKKLAVILSAGDKLGAESKTPSGPDNSIREAIEVCRKVGFKGFDADDLDVIAATPAERREVVAKKLMGSGAGNAGAGEERPTSRAREGIVRQPNPPTTEAAPTTAKEFAALIKG